jgi:hypothetical protein
VRAAPILAEKNRTAGLSNLLSAFPIDFFNQRIYPQVGRICCTWLAVFNILLEAAINAIRLWLIE